VYIGATVLSGSTAINVLPASDNGSWYGIVFDLNRLLLWVTRDGVNWNSGGTADPVCGIGGYDISALSAGSYFLASSEVLSTRSPQPSITLITNSNSGAARGTLPTCVAWW